MTIKIGLDEARLPHGLKFGGSTKKRVSLKLQKGVFILTKKGSFESVTFLHLIVAKKIC